ncbi:MAG: hypothetical protein ABIJ74_03975 [archaeon]
MNHMRRRLQIKPIRTGIGFSARGNQQTHGIIKKRKKEKQRKRKRRENRIKLVETHSVLLENETISTFSYVLRMAKIYPRKIITRRRNMVPAKKLLAFFEIAEGIPVNKRQYKNTKLTTTEFDAIKKFCESRRITSQALNKAIEELYSNIDKIEYAKLGSGKKVPLFSLVVSDFFVDKQPGKKFVFTVSHR